MHQESSNIDKNSCLSGVKRAQIEGWTVELLQPMPYEVNYTPEHSVIGFSFDSQSGTHAFSSDKRSSFHALPNGLAWVPAGCDVYSQSRGGEYLKITCARIATGSNIWPERFSDVIDTTAISSAFSLRRALCSKAHFDHLACELWLLAMESSVFAEPRDSDKHKGWVNKRRLRLIDEIIDARLDTQLTVSKLACELGISAGFFSREFKGAVGRSPHQYIVDKRLKRARAMLEKSNHDLITIALACGFSSHSHMTSFFRKQLGITPSQLRRESS